MNRQRLHQSLIPFRLRRGGRGLPAKTRPRVVLLQGPVGPFFLRLQEYLERSGFDAWRITLNAADRFLTPAAKRIDFAGDRLEWEGWFGSFLKGAQIDHLILFSCTRPAHETARRLAANMPIQVLSLEEGYFRPGFITAEAGGNNACSPLAGRLPPADFEGGSHAVPHQDFRAFRAMCLHGARYYIVRTLLGTARERAMFHRRFSVASEPFLWGRNYWRYLARRAKDFRTVEHLLEHFDGRYFLVPLQVASDGQMGPSAMDWNASRLIGETLRSFAGSASVRQRLVFKIHPLERGHGNERRLICQTADALGIPDRVDVIDTGPLSLLTRHSAGMITINSTSGLSAIHHGVPLLVVGDALYAHDSLATCARGEPDLDQFWKGGLVAGEETRRRYLAWVQQEALVPGDFYAAEGIPVACAGIAEKLRQAAPECVISSEITSVAC